MSATYTDLLDATEAWQRTKQMVHSINRAFVRAEKASPIGMFWDSTAYFTTLTIRLREAQLRQAQAEAQVDHLCHLLEVSLATPTP